MKALLRLFVPTENTTADAPLPSAIMRHSNEMLIEPMAPADWPEVVAIYKQGMATGLGTFETVAPSWDDWDSARSPHSRLVARENGRVVGWAALSPVSKRACYAGVAEIGIYVAENARGHGVGGALLKALVASSEANGIWTLQGVTFADNAASIAVQQSCGFRMVGRRERIGKREGVWRDTVILERRSPTVGVD
jgi:phosphinothricin acetyltransferase